MNILALDTSGSSASCAVLQNGIVRASWTSCAGLTHSETILPAVDSVMETAGVALKELDCVAVVAGPGSFTGVRIGVCLAKGIAHASGLACARINALEALARNFYACDGRIICPILDARRDQVYTAQFLVENGRTQRISEDMAISVHDLTELLPMDKRIIFTGDGVARQRSELTLRMQERADFAPANLSQISPAAVAVLALEDLNAWIPARELKPIYLRKPQAERQRKDDK